MGPPITGVQANLCERSKEQGRHLQDCEELMELRGSVMGEGSSVLSYPGFWA